MFPSASGASVGMSCVSAISRPSIRYVLMHSLKRPKSCVCPGQTVKVPPTFQVVFPGLCQRPYWHVCLSASTVCGGLTVNSMADMNILALFSTHIPPLIGLIKPSWCMRQAVLLSRIKKSRAVITVRIHGHWQGRLTVFSLPGPGMQTQTGVSPEASVFWSPPDQPGP